MNSYSVHVKTFLEQSSDGAMLEPVFKCVVDHPQDGVLYDVQWFIGNDLIPKADSHNLTYQTMNTSSLKTDHWADNYSLNFNVSIGSQRIEIYLLFIFFILRFSMEEN